MEKKNLSDEELDNLLRDLSEVASTPKDKFSAEASYQKLEMRLQNPNPKRIHILKYIAVASVILALSLSVWMLNTESDPQQIMIVTADQIQEVTLPDGTLVTLSRYSELGYPAVFKGETREVTLSGEGDFKVFKDKEHPFIVQAQDVQVKVLGTHFNIQSYADNPYITTTLVEGSVEVSNTRNEETIILKPNESVVYCKETAKMRQITEVDEKKEKLIFDNIPLSRIVEELSNHFDVKIEIADKELKTYKLTARFEKGESIDEILALLQVAGNFTWKKSTNSIIIKAK